jgi:hypothetical protein
LYAAQNVIKLVMIQANTGLESKLVVGRRNRKHFAKVCAPLVISLWSCTHATTYSATKTNQSHDHKHESSKSFSL